MYRKFSWLVLISLILTSCQTATSTAAPTPGVQQPTVTAAPGQPSAVPSAEPSQTAPTKRTLVICVGQEPSSLYIYGSSAVGMWSVLEAVYDGPFDTRGFAAQPVILQDLPSQANGNAVVSAVEVKAGDAVVDQGGNLASLAAGTKVNPAGCSGDTCGAAWDGKKALKLDQLKVTFKLKPGIQWSDGQPLTADDSVYSYELASSPDTPVSKNIVDRTVAYKALDETTVEWTGLPGFVPDQLDTLFFIPLPRHAWAKYKPADLLTAEDSTRHPLGWGPYVVDEWKAGDHISLHKNPAYFRASEGLPKFDALVFRFLGDQSNNNLTALDTHECDLVDQTVLLDNQLKDLVDQSNTGQIKVQFGQGPEWEHLDFGIRPSSYDDGFKPALDRADFFSDVRVRQAFANCIDRAGLVQDIFFNRTSVPAGYYPPSSPYFETGLKALAYDPAAGARLLDEAGWKIDTANPNGPRLAVGSSSAPKGTPFVVNYFATNTPLRMQVAQAIAQGLAKCGVQVKIQPTDIGPLFSGGPDGPLFGRKFDLTQFAWQSGTQSPCFLYTTDQIPTAKNNWLGANITGYSNPKYDSVCKDVLQASPNQANYPDLAHTAEQLFWNELPVIPLYYRLKIVATRPDFCGFQMDVTTRSALWGIEAFDYGTNCK